MLKYPCLVLDHDDTVVQSEATINYPYFCYILDVFRPGATITLSDYICGCSSEGFVGMCRSRFNFTDAELEEEYRGWKEYIRSHAPAPYPGIDRIIRRQKEEGGIICVVSMSSQENILRDYRMHFGIEPDEIYGWDLAEEHRKPSPYALEQLMKKHGFTPDQLLVVDDMQPAWQMARAAGSPVAFAGWGRKEFPSIYQEMNRLCDFTFDTTEALERYLFEE